MPQLLQYMDQIARDKKRDVLLLSFNVGQLPTFNYRKIPVRKKILAWLDCNTIPYVECSICTSDVGTSLYQGEIYLDVPFDTENEQYKKLADYLEDENGVVKHKKVGFHYYPYALAIKIVPRVYSDPDF